MSSSQPDEEVSNEQIYADLKQYADAGMIEYVLPTEPLGEEWIIGFKGHLLKIVTKEGAVGFLTGIGVCATWVVDQHPRGGAPLTVSMIPDLIKAAREEDVPRFSDGTRAAATRPTGASGAPAQVARFLRELADDVEAARR